MTWHWHQPLISPPSYASLIMSKPFTMSLVFRRRSFLLGYLSPEIQYVPGPSTSSGLLRVIVTWSSSKDWTPFLICCGVAICCLLQKRKAPCRGHWLAVALFATGLVSLCSIPSYPSCAGRPSVQCKQKWHLARTHDSHHLAPQPRAVGWWEGVAQHRWGHHTAAAYLMHLMLPRPLDGSSLDTPGNGCWKSTRQPSTPQRTPSMASPNKCSKQKLLHTYTLSAMSWLQGTLYVWMLILLDFSIYIHIMCIYNI